MHENLNRQFYRETVRGASVSEGKVVRRTGGGVFAHVQVAVRALNRGQGTVLAWNEGLSFPSKFVPSVAQGIEDALNAGDLAGLQVVDVHVSVEDGSYHDVDSTANAFREAAELATRRALGQAAPLILESLTLMTVSVPEESIASVMETVLAHGGRIKPPLHDAAPQRISVSMPAARANELIAELLETTGGLVRIVTAPDGFQPFTDPPDSIDQWAKRG